MSSLYEHSFTLSDGSIQPMSVFKDKVLLVVNTASKCGFTPQFKGLEKLHQQYGERGLVVLGFPCNQFANQDPGDINEITEFCQLNYGVSFLMAEKIDVNGSHTHPLFAELKTQAKGLLGSEKIKWNFTKFLIGPQGSIIKRYGSTTKPAAIAADIEKLIN